MDILRITHASLRFDVPVNATVGYLVDLIDDQQTDILTTTEANRRAIGRRLRRRLGPAWGVEQRNEYLIAWNRDAVRSRSKLSTLVASAKYMIFGRMQRQFVIASKLFELDNGRSMWVDMAHAPSGVQDGDHWRKSALPGRVVAAKSGFARWGVLDRKRKQNDRHVIQLKNYDGNLDLRNPVWMSYLTEELGSPSVWAWRMPGHNTHGDRLIDGANIDGAYVIAAWVTTGPRPKGMDHRAFTYVISAN